MCMFVYFSKAKKKSAVRKDKQILFHAITMLINNFNLFDLPWSHTLNLCYEHKQQTRWVFCLSTLLLFSLLSDIQVSSTAPGTFSANLTMRVMTSLKFCFCIFLLWACLWWNIMFKRLNSIMCVLVISMHEMMYLMDVSWLIRVWKWIIMQKTTGRGQ